MIAPPALRNTLAAALGRPEPACAPASPGSAVSSPTSPSRSRSPSRAPFGAAGVPAVELSLSGRAAAPPAGPARVAGTPQLAGLGRAVLSTISALDAARRSPPRRPTCCSTARSCPAGRSSLFVLDADRAGGADHDRRLARARRRGYQIGRSLARCSPRLSRSCSPGAWCWPAAARRHLGRAARPLGAGVDPATGSAIAVLAVAALVSLVSAVAAAPAVSALLAAAGGACATHARGLALAHDRAARGRVAAALLIVLWLVTLAIWAATRSRRRCSSRRCICGCGRSTPICAAAAGAAGDARARGWCRSALVSSTTPARSASPAAAGVGGGAAARRPRGRLVGGSSGASCSAAWSARDLVLPAARGPSAQPARSPSAARSPTPARARWAAPSRRCGADPIRASAPWRVMRRLIRDFSSVLILRACCWCSTLASRWSGRSRSRPRSVWSSLADQ